MLKFYLTIFGINPYKSVRVNNIIVTTILTGCFSVCTPLAIKFYYSMCDKYYDEIFDDFPQVVMAFLIITKFINIHSNQAGFKKLFDLMMEERQLFSSEEELYMLDAMNEKGRKLASFYGKTLTMFMSVYLFLPLYHPFMDIISPLNETRPRQHIYKVNYLFFDEFEYFYTVYLHLASNAALVVFVLIGIDTLYINIIYHACGLFAVCGYRVIKTTENYVAQKFEAGTDMSGYEDFKRCVTLHHEALRYYNVLDNTCRNLYLVQMGINMILISVTAVKLIMYLEQLDQAIRSAMFLAGQQFHLYIISLPGQKLLDQSSELSNQIYASSWYETSVVIQKLLHTMQIRSSRSSILTAAGLYEMKIESFGITVKTCVSYCTMFLSLRD
ncbi:unnamed protein product [Xylocopa violacea]|uniref:Odorant receptor n=1 Tax=Xylocopa violacea TaxID=135666 RepID=A0ABP1N8F4_XYLVO